MLRLAGSLKLGRVPATGIMRTLQVGDRPTRLAQAVAEFGRIDKTLHSLSYLDDEDRRRAILLQLNRGEGRHSLAREVFHGKRGGILPHVLAPASSGSRPSPLIKGGEGWGLFGARSAAHDPFPSTAGIPLGRACEGRDRFRPKGPGSGAAFVCPRRAGMLK